MGIKAVGTRQIIQNAAPAVDGPDKKITNSDEGKAVKTVAGLSPDETSDLKAVFAIDDSSKKIVIRLIGKNGKTILQFPPEQLIELSKELNLPVKNLLNKEA